jgi:hypothetical protein
MTQNDCDVRMLCDHLIDATRVITRPGAGVRLILTATRVTSSVGAG